ncbi:uncharacterized protein LJ264_005015 [Porphyrio hochstetteri]
MSGLRRLFRGSGRALAFVFAASVVWLLLDMAALRLSLGDAGGRLLKEAAGRGGRGQGLWRGPDEPAGSPRPDPAGPRRARRTDGGSPARRGPPRRGGRPEERPVAPAAPAELAPALREASPGTPRPPREPPSPAPPAPGRAEPAATVAEGPRHAVNGSGQRAAGPRGDAGPPGEAGPPGRTERGGG